MNSVAPRVASGRSPHLPADEEESLLVVTIAEGRQIVEAPQGTLIARPANLLLITSRHAGRIGSDRDVKKRVVHIPLQALRTLDTGGAVPDVLLLDTQENVLAALTMDYLAGMDNWLGARSSAETDAARNALMVLVAGCIRSARTDISGPSDLLPLLRRRLESWIVAHLSDGSIKVAELAAAHNVAVRTVHRAFASTGDTVGSVTRAHRIAAARQDLVTTSLPVTAIAHRWGFCDPSHLGRLFREVYSMSPGDYRERFAESAMREERMPWGA